MSSETPQERFDRIYISSVEIMSTLKVSRTAISQARKRGLLPNAIISHAGTMVLWERETIMPNVEAWGRIINIRRQRTE